jgi:hypothetical protein
MPITPFLTATGFLAAILLVWAQSWISIYKPKCLPRTVGLGLTWTYLTVVVALVAFACAGWCWWKAGFKENFQVANWSVGLLVSVLIMTGIDVGQSLLSSAIKFWKGEPVDEPLTKIEEKLKTAKWRRGLIAGAFAIAAFIIIMSYLGSTRSNVAFWIAEVGLLGILGIGFIIWVKRN